MIDSPSKAPRAKPLPTSGRVPYSKPRPKNLFDKIDPARPETDPCRRSLVAHELAGEREIDAIFRDSPTTLVIISPTEMLTRADWQKHKK